MFAGLWPSTSNFYPRPPRGGRLSAGRGADLGGLFLSTPSARRATRTRRTRPSPMTFLSTPSARRATDGLEAVNQFIEISIHALREEGDCLRRASRSLP